MPAAANCMQLRGSHEIGAVSGASGPDHLHTASQGRHSVRAAPILAAWACRDVDLYSAHHAHLMSVSHPCNQGHAGPAPMIFQHIMSCGFATVLDPAWTASMPSASLSGHNLQLPICRCATWQAAYNASLISGHPCMPLPGPSCTPCSHRQQDWCAGRQTLSGVGACPRVQPTCLLHALSESAGEQDQPRQEITSVPASLADPTSDPALASATMQALTVGMLPRRIATTRGSSWSTAGTSSLGNPPCTTPPPSATCWSAAPWSSSWRPTPPLGLPASTPPTTPRPGPTAPCRLRPTTSEPGG